MDTYVALGITELITDVPFLGGPVTPVIVKGAYKRFYFSSALGGNTIGLDQRSNFPFFVNAIAGAQGRFLYAAEQF